MTAAVITATVVGKMDSPTELVSGSNRRLKKLYLEGAKAADNDWFLLSTYLSAGELTQIVGWTVLRETSANAYAIDVATYDSDDYKFILTENTAGTVSAFIDYYEV